MEVPLLLVCDCCDGHEGDHGQETDAVSQGEGGKASADRGEPGHQENDIGWSRNDEKQEGLCQGDENNVENEHERGSTVIFHNLPAIVFAADGISSSSVVIVRQSTAPYRACYCDSTNSGCVKSGHVRVDCIVQIVD